MVAASLILMVVEGWDRRPDAGVQIDLRNRRAFHPSRRKPA